MNRIIVVLAFTIFLASAMSAQTVAEILDGAFLLGRSEHAQMKIQMIINDRQGEKTRELAVFTLDKSTISRLLVKVTAPAALSAMKFLRVAPANGGNQQWIKTSRGVRRLGGEGSGEKLFNSDFSIDDFSVYDSKALTIVRLNEKEDAEHFVLDLRSKNNSEMHRIVSIDRVTKLVSRVEYVGVDGAITKLYEVEEWGTESGLAYPKKARMADKLKGTWTILSVNSIDRTTSVAESMFNPAGL